MTAEQLQDKTEAAGGASAVDRRVRPRKFAVGQIWSAIYRNKFYGTRIAGYGMQILHKERYYDADIGKFRDTWLAVKLYVEKRPGMEITQCYWFDDRGVSKAEEDQDWIFELTRKRPNASLNGPNRRAQADESGTADPAG